MTSTRKLLITVTTTLLALTATASTSNTRSHSHSSLAARLKVDDGEVESTNCWDSLVQLQACTGEVIMFFLNGETYLGPSCCQAIRVVGHDCWPEMLASLGFTAQEGDILQGYCDAKQQHSPPSSPSPATLDDATRVLP